MFTIVMFRLYSIEIEYDYNYSEELGVFETNLNQIKKEKFDG